MFSITRELQDRFKSFAQFHSSREHEQFIQNLVKEKELKFRLTECYKYRRNGITRAEECVEFERMKSRKKLQMEAASTSEATGGDAQTNGSLPVIPELPQSSAEVMTSHVNIGGGCYSVYLFNHSILSVNLFLGSLGSLFDCACHYR